MKDLSSGCTLSTEQNEKKSELRERTKPARTKINQNQEFSNRNTV